VGGWYYVSGSERVGPVDQDEIIGLYQAGSLNLDSYVWRKGFDNWQHIKNVTELASVLENSNIDDEDEEISIPNAIPERVQAPVLNWNNLNHDAKTFHIKVGLDRGGDEVEYGPFSLNEMKQLFDDQRINAKTFVFTTGMENWSFLGDLPIYSSLFTSLPPKIDPVDRRVSIRKPFVARLLFHDNATVYEGICRDISVGGLQILVSDFPARVGEEITLNVHPDNSDTKFVATGLVVRLLDGNQGFSMRFKALSREAGQAIEQYLNQR
jgi:hypothetical protein